jgi:inosine-uridine nucleoside N-ribohydrolase
MRAIPLFPVLALTAALAAAEPVPVIFDTDMGNDIDDALALAVLHALESRAECRLIAVTVTKDNRWAAPYVSLVNAFYGRPDIPVGVVRGGRTPEDSPMIRVPCQRTRPDGSRLYPRGVEDGTRAPEAVEVLRKALAAEKDGAVVVVQVGFSTNLARLLDSKPDGASPLDGAGLVKRKVRLLSVMAGRFPPEKPEYNVQVDIPAARRVFGHWPGEIVASGWEVGAAILYPARSIENDFRYVENHPVADAYRAYKKMPYDRPTWDLTAALYAVRPDRGYFSLSQRGRIRVDDEGRTRLEPVSGGPHRHLIVDQAQRARTLAALETLASQPPRMR